MTKTILAILAVTATAALTLPASASFAPMAAGFHVWDIAGGADQVDKRSKPRVPGGSGCDTPRDIAEHLECQP